MHLEFKQTQSKVFLACHNTITECFPAKQLLQLKKPRSTEECHRLNVDADSNDTKKEIIARLLQSSTISKCSQNTSKNSETNPSTSLALWLKEIGLEKCLENLVVYDSIGIIMDYDIDGIDEANANETNSFKHIVV